MEKQGSVSGQEVPDVCAGERRLGLHRRQCSRQSQVRWDRVSRGGNSNCEAAERGH